MNRAVREQLERLRAAVRHYEALAARTEHAATPTDGSPTTDARLWELLTEHEAILPRPPTCLTDHTDRARCIACVEWTQRVEALVLAPPAEPDQVVWDYLCLQILTRNQWPLLETTHQTLLTRMREANENGTLRHALQQTFDNWATRWDTASNYAHLRL